MNPILHSKVLGEGCPLLILHGFLGMLDNWKTLGDAYARKGFRVHLIDLRNHGKSFHSNTFSYTLMAKDLEDYMLYYAIEKAFILGHSMGGKLAMRFASDYPDKVSALMVADIAPRYYAPHHQQILKGLNALDFNQIKSRQQAEAILRNYVEDAGNIQFLLKNLYRLPENTYALRANLSALTENIDNVGEALPKGALFTGKTLFLKGENSKYITETDIPDIKKHFPEAKLRIIPNAGHWVHADNPHAFFEETILFFEENRVF